MRKNLIQLLWRVNSSLRSYSLNASDVRSYKTTNIQNRKGRGREVENSLLFSLPWLFWASAYGIAVDKKKKSTWIMHRLYIGIMMKNQMWISSKSNWEVLSLSSVQLHPYTVLLTQAGQCGERQNAKEKMQLTQRAWFAKILQNQTPPASLEPEHLNRIQVT